MKLNRFSRFMVRRAGLVAILGVCLALVGSYFSVQLYKNLRTDIEELLPREARSGKDLDALTARLQAIDTLAVLVYSNDTQASRRFVDDLAGRLQQLPKTLAASIEYRIDREVKFFHSRLALYLSLPDLIKVRDYVRDRIKFEREMYNPLNIFPVTDHLKKPELDFEALRKKYQGSGGGAYTKFPGGYYSTPDQKKRVILVYMAGKHSDIHQAEALAAAVRQIVAELKPQSYAPDLRVEYTGEVQSFLEEHAALIADLALSTIIVILLVSGAMLAFYRDLRATASLVASLFCGTLWTFGVAYWLVGYLNANSAFLGSIVIGNGINFGIIWLARYMEERRRRQGNVRAIDIAMRTTATSTWTAALAAGLSYGSLMLTHFRGFRQFGIIGLVGMVLCWISAFTLMPAFLALFDRSGYRPKTAKRRDTPLFAGWLASQVERNARPICIISAVITLAALLTFPRYSPKIIETDLNNLRNKASMEHGAGFYDRDLIEIFHRYLSPIVIMPQNRADAVKIADLLKQKKAAEGAKSQMATIQTLDDFVPDHQQEKIAILKDMKKSLTPQVMSSLEGDEKAWVRDYLTDEAMVPFTEKDLPKLVLDKFTEKDGTRGKLVLVEPPLNDAHSIVSWDGRALIAFIHELRETADEVAPGTPVAGQLPISADLVESISKDGPKATLFAFLAVVALVFILFREPMTSGLTLFALLLGVVWLAGLILGFGWKINFLNFIALPITFGIGVDYGVNIFQRYRQEGRGRIVPVVSHAGGAVMLASLTTIIGYSSLLIAENQAFVSFGRLAVLGEICCITAAVIALPAFLCWRDRRQGASRPEPESATTRHAEVSTVE